MSASIKLETLQCPRCHGHKTVILPATSTLPAKRVHCVCCAERGRPSAGVITPGDVTRALDYGATSPRSKARSGVWLHAVTSDGVTRRWYWSAQGEYMRLAVITSEKGYTYAPAVTPDLLGKQVLLPGKKFFVAAQVTAIEPCESLPLGYQWAQEQGKPLATVSTGGPKEPESHPEPIQEPPQGEIAWQIAINHQPDVLPVSEPTQPTTLDEAIAEFANAGVEVGDLQ